MTRRSVSSFAEDDDEQALAPGPTPQQWIGYVLGALWRRRVRAGATFVIILGLATIYYATRSPRYKVETTILAQRQQALPSIGRPTAQDDVPTRTASEMIHRRESLLALIRQADLLADPRHPGLHGGLRQRLSRWIAQLFGAQPPTPEDELNALAERLGKELVVETSDGTIAISFEWFDATQAYRVVEAAVQNFLEARHLQEVTVMDEAISLLQGRQATLRAQLDRAVEESRSEVVRDEAPARAAPLPLAASEELVQLRSKLEAKERAVADIEEFRRRRQSDLQAQLDAQRAVYSEAHPNIIALRHDLEALSRESPQVAPLREEARKLRGDYAVRLAQETARQPGVPAPRRGAAAETERVRQARAELAQMVERINAAQLDLDAARAAFKYRYAVVWPAQMPREPVSPRPLKIFGLGLIAALLGTVALVTGLELRAGRLQYRWQVEQELALPVLGSIRER